MKLALLSFASLMVASVPAVAQQQPPTQPVEPGHPADMRQTQPAPPVGRDGQPLPPVAPATAEEPDGKDNSEPRSDADDRETDRPGPPQS